MLAATRIFARAAARGFYVSMTRIAEARRFYARLLAANAGAKDPRLEEAFAAIPREAFLGPGPWTVIVVPWTAGRHAIETPSADPVHLYQNHLVALDRDKGINNGEPLLHAMWMTKIAPKPGEHVTHIGAGTGYYSAILSRLVEPDGEVTAYEYEAHLAARAADNLAAYDNVTVVHGDAVRAQLPPSDVIYVNAGAIAPPASWLQALKPGGRLVFPWRPAEKIGLAVLITRLNDGFACQPFMRSWFIPCVGASRPGRAPDVTVKVPSSAQAKRIRSILLTEQKAPDATAVAIFGDVWFSSRSLDNRRSG